VVLRLLALELDLTSKLLQLDEISGASPIVRTARKALVSKIEGINAKLDTLKKVYARTEPEVQETAPESDATAPTPVSPMEIEQETPAVPDVEVKEADSSEDNEQLKFFREGEQQQPESQERIGQAGPQQHMEFSGEEPLVQPVDEEEPQASSPAEQEMPHIEDADNDLTIVDAPSEDTSAPLLKDPTAEEIDPEPEPIDAEPLPPSVVTDASSSSDPETVPLLSEAASPSVPDVPMDDGWVCMGSPTDTTTTTKPTLQQSVQQPTNIQPQQILSLKKMCYNLCNQLLQRAIANPVH